MPQPLAMPRVKGLNPTRETLFPILFQALVLARTSRPIIRPQVKSCKYRPAQIQRPPRVPAAPLAATQLRPYHARLGESWEVWLSWIST